MKVRKKILSQIMVPVRQERLANGWHPSLLWVNIDYPLMTSIHPVLFSSLPATIFLPPLSNLGLVNLVLGGLYGCYSLRNP